MARINSLVDDGVTLLFVSHDIGVVRQLCSRAVLIERGRLMADSSASQVSDLYMKVQLEERNQTARPRESILEQSTSPQQSVSGVEPQNDDQLFGINAFRARALANRVGNGTAEIFNVQMLRNGAHAVEFEYNEAVEIRVFARFNEMLTNVNHAVIIRTMQGTDVVYLDTRLQAQMDVQYERGKTYCFSWKLTLPLLHTQYTVLVGLTHPPLRAGDDWIIIDHIPHTYEFKVAPRRQGMINALVALPAELDISKLTVDRS